MPQRPDFDFAAFYKALSATMAARDLNWKAVSEQTGVSQSTLSRMSRGRHSLTPPASQPCPRGRGSTP